MNEKFKVRTVTVKGNFYIRVEDVAKLFIDFGATEETDVRNRSQEMARNLVNLTGKSDSTK